MSKYYYYRALEDAYDYLLETIGREPTDEEIQNYIDELNALAEESAYDSEEAELKGN